MKFTISDPAKNTKSKLTYVEPLYMSSSFTFRGSAEFFKKTDVIPDLPS